MYNFGGYVPAQWTPSALYSICTETMPGKMIADDDYFVAIAPVLSAFLKFLAQNKYQNQASQLAERVQGLGAKIVNAAKDPSNWGTGKSFMMRVQDDGVDTTDADALRRYTAERNRMVAEHLALSPGREPQQPALRNAPKVGRNDFCPCGSGKKYKKCCLSTVQDETAPH